MKERGDSLAEPTDGSAEQSPNDRFSGHVISQFLQIVLDDGRAFLAESNPQLRCGENGPEYTAEGVRSPLVVVQTISLTNLFSTTTENYQPPQQTS